MAKNYMIAVLATMMFYAVVGYIVGQLFLRLIH